jgi:hypothetical protein
MALVTQPISRAARGPAGNPLPAPGSVERRRASLALANHARLDAAAVKRDIRTGRLTVQEALDDPRAGSVSALGLLRAMPMVGSTRARGMLRRAQVGENRKVRDMTGRELVALGVEARR